MVNEILTLFMLVVLQAVLGIDNLLYISIESKNAPAEKQAWVRKIGLYMAILIRIALLFIIVNLIPLFQNPIITQEIENVFSINMNIHSMIVLAGGIFILYIAVKEIWHMIDYDFSSILESRPKSTKSVGAIMTMIMVMNVVFSFDSILSAIALTKTMWVMIVGIIIGGLLMVAIAERVDQFLHKNRMFEVLGLFILLLVGVMLTTEGGHLAHLKLFGNEITPMNQTTLYFTITILVAIDIVQTKYKKNLLKKQELKKQMAENKI